MKKETIAIKSIESPLSIKKAIRQRLKGLRPLMPRRLQEEAVLLQHAKAWLYVHKPRAVGLYCPMSHEVNILSLQDFCFQQHIIPCYPVVMGQCLVFRRVWTLQDFLPGRFNTPEPLQMHPEISPDVVIVPGLAFTPQGDRLGLGQGYYDRYLATHRPQTLGLAFSWMRCSFPVEAHDYRIDHVLWGD